jgi:hypothetical protein
LLVVTGVASVFAGSGAVAGAGAGGVVSEAGGWADAAPDGAWVVEVGVGSSFFGFFLKRPLNAFFIWSMASGAVGILSDICTLERCEGEQRDTGFVG